MRSVGFSGLCNSLAANRPSGLLSASLMWVMLLEKAFAKLAGSYGNLTGGHFALAWQVLTGCEEQWSFVRAGSGKSWKKMTCGRVSKPESRDPLA